MREILFRGKRLDNGEWEEGDLLRAKWYLNDVDHHFIFTDAEAFPANEFIGYAEVLPETVGQYTGLKDKNGKRIFEGDVVAQSWYDFNEPTDDSFGEVCFCECDCSFSVLDFNKKSIMSMGHGFSYHYEVEIIGNIHDNPELLRGGGEE